MTSSDPYVDVFVQFDDGRLVRYTSYVGLIRDRSIKRSYQDQDFWDMEFMLVSLRDEHAKIIAGNRPTTILQSGKACTQYMIPCHSDPTSLLPICYTSGADMTNDSGMCRY
jgi:hypothetical protein